jgi:hypothetical protein
MAPQHWRNGMATAIVDPERARLVGDREIAINRIVDAPRELVFRAWIDPNTIGQPTSSRHWKAEQ